MPNKIETSADGKTITVELETGEKFSGDPMEVTTRMAEAHVNTKHWGQEWKQKAENPPAPPAPVVPPTPEAQNEAQLQAYLLNQTAKALGYESADQYKADLARVKSTTDEVNNQLVAGQFLASCQDFPNSPESVEALSKKIDDMKWDFTPQSMIAAHALCLREDKYKALTAEEINATWSQGLQHSNRATPPPMIRGAAPDSNAQGFNPWAKDLKLEDLRAMAIKQQLEGR